MKRIVDICGTVHYAHPSDERLSLCGRRASEVQADLFLGSDSKPWKESTDPVDCPFCAKTVCAIRYEPYNTIVESVSHDVLICGMYDAIKNGVNNGSYSL